MNSSFNCPYCGKELVVEHRMCPYCRKWIPKKETEEERQGRKFAEVFLGVLVALSFFGLITNNIFLVLPLFLIVIIFAFL